MLDYYLDPLGSDASAGLFLFLASREIVMNGASLERDNIPGTSVGLLPFWPACLASSEHVDWAIL